MHYCFHFTKIKKIVGAAGFEPAFEVISRTSYDYPTYKIGSLCPHLTTCGRRWIRTTISRFVHWHPLSDRGSTSTALMPIADVDPNPFPWAIRSLIFIIQRFRQSFQQTVDLSEFHLLRTVPERPLECCHPLGLMRIRSNISEWNISLLFSFLLKHLASHQWIIKVK